MSEEVRGDERDTTLTDGVKLRRKNASKCSNEEGRHWWRARNKILDSAQYYIRCSGSNGLISGNRSTTTTTTTPPRAISARGLCGSRPPPYYGLGRVKGTRQCARVDRTHIPHHTLSGRTLFFSHHRVTRRLRCGPGRIAIDYRDFAASSQ